MDIRARQGAILLLLQAGLILQACIPAAHGHGLLYSPAARQFQAYNPEERNYEAFSNNGGGVLSVSRNNKLKWPQGVHSLCGDPQGQSKWMEPREVQATYTAGQIITTNVLIWNHHGGRFGFNVCPKGATNHGDCLPLMRADGKSRWWYPPLPPNDLTLSKLWTVYGPNLQVGSDTDGHFSYFRVPDRKDGMNQFKGTPVYVTEWRLPNDFSCEDGCILQWYWLTGNSCWPACDKADPKYPKCRSRCTRPNCICGEDEGTAYPEEFWNCADIRVLPASAKNSGRRPHRGPAPVRIAPMAPAKPEKASPKKAPAKGVKAAKKSPAKKPIPAKKLGKAPVKDKKAGSKTKRGLLSDGVPGQGWPLLELLGG